MRTTALLMILVCPLALAVQDPMEKEQDPEKEKLFSGPQKGEKIATFKVYDVNGPNQGKEHDYLKDYGKAPTLIVFIHELTRPGAQLFRRLDEYAWIKRDYGLKALFVVLTADQDAMERRMPMVVRAINLKSTVGVSPDGMEGPGAYGLNKEVTLTILVAKEGVVTANFAILSPNETDVPNIIKALNLILPKEMPQPRLDTPEDMKKEILHLREEIRLLRKEMESLRKLLNQVRQGNRRRRRRPGRMEEPKKLPGKIPEDEKMVGFLRGIIQKTNTDEDVDALIKEMEEYCGDDKEKKKAMAGGLIRILAVKYGTDYAKKKMQELKERLEKEE